MALNYSYDEVLEVISTLGELRNVVSAAPLYNDQVISEFSDYDISSYLENTYGQQFSSMGTIADQIEEYLSGFFTWIQDANERAAGVNQQNIQRAGENPYTGGGNGLNSVTSTGTSTTNPNTGTSTATSTGTSTTTSTGTSTTTSTGTSTTTSTGTSTITSTGTSTITSTGTSTTTSTGTSTTTSTGTSTVTSNPTTTSTATSSVTSSVTSSLTSTITSRPTITSTATSSVTSSLTSTITSRPTITSTATSSVTSSLTSTITSRPTITSTTTSSVTSSGLTSSGITSYGVTSSGITSSGITSSGITSSGAGITSSIGTGPGRDIQLKGPNSGDVGKKITGSLSTGSKGIGKKASNIIEAVEKGAARLAKGISPKFSGEDGSGVSAGMLASAGLIGAGAVAGAGFLIGKRFQTYTFTPKDWENVDEITQQAILADMVKATFTESEIETFKNSTFKIRASELNEHTKKIQKASEIDENVETQLNEVYNYSLFDDENNVIRYFTFITMIIDGKRATDEFNMYTILNPILEEEDEVDFIYTGINMEEYIFDEDIDGEEVEIANDPTSENISEGQSVDAVDKEWLSGIGLDIN